MFENALLCIPIKFQLLSIKVVGEELQQQSSNSEKLRPDKTTNRAATTMY